MANILDKFTQATTNSRPTPTTVSSIRAAAGTTLSCLALTGWPTGTAVHFITYKINTSGAKIAGSQIDWKGIVSGTTITGLVLQAGTDVGNAVGDVVEAAPTAAYANDLQAGLVKDHDTQGRHVQLTDTNGNLALGIIATASAVNYVQITNSITGAAPQIAPAGTDSNIDLKVDAKGTGVVKVQGAVPQKFFAIYDFIESGCLITPDSAGVNKNYSMTSGVVWIGGKRLTVAAVSAQTVGASKDRYIDFTDNGDGTAAITNTEVANNAASPALTGVRAGIVVAGATFITNQASINQGDPAALLPIASSVAYSVTDSLGNLICPRDPGRKLLGYKEVSANQAGFTAATLITGLSVPIIAPGNRNVVISSGFSFDTTVSDTATSTSLKEGGTYLDTKGYGAASGYKSAFNSRTTRPSAGLHTYTVEAQRNSGTGNVVPTATGGAGTPGPSWIRVELE